MDIRNLLERIREVQDSLHHTTKEFLPHQRVTTEGKGMADTHYIATLSDGSVEKLTCCDKYGHFKVGDKVTVTRLIKNVGRFIHIELFITSMKAA